MPRANDESENGRSETNRRRLLQTVGVVGIAGVAGCLGGDDGDDGNGTENGDDGNGTENGDDGNGTENGDDGEAAFELSDLVPADETVTWYETVTVEATVTNTGDAAGEEDVEGRIGGETIATESVTLNPDESGPVSFDIDTADLDPGEHTYGVYVADEEETATLTVETFGDEPETIFSFDDESDGTIGISPGTTAVTATFANPYPFPIEAGEVELEEPGEVGVSPVDGTSFDALEQSGSQTAEWEFDASEDVAGDEYPLTATVTYAAAGDEAEQTHEVSVFVAGAPTISTAELDVDDPSELGPQWVHASAPETDGGPADEPAFTFPENDDHVEINVDSWDGPDDTVETYLGYDSENFYFRTEVVDEVHDTVPGTDMWSGDSVQFATASGPGLNWGAEYAARHDAEADEPEMVQYSAGESDSGADEIEIETNREGDLTTYDLAIPWDALLPSAPEPGDTVPFDVVNFDREEDGEWAGASAWSNFAVFAPKFPENLGRITLENDGDELPYEVSLIPEGPGSIAPGEAGTWTVTVANWADVEQEISIDVRDTDVEESLVLGGKGAAEVSVEWTPAGNRTVAVDFDNGEETYAVETDVTVS